MNVNEKQQNYSIVKWWVVKFADGVMNYLKTLIKVSVQMSVAFLKCNNNPISVCIEDD